MKLGFAILLFTLFGAVSWAESLDQPAKLYDQLLKVTFQADQPLQLELGGTKYPFGPFNDKKPFLQAIAADTDASAFFRRADSDQRAYLFSTIGGLALDFGALGVEIGLVRTTNDPQLRNTYYFTSLGMLGGALVLSFLVQGYWNSAQENFYKGVNQYNRDILGANPQP